MSTKQVDDIVCILSISAVNNCFVENEVFHLTEYILLSKEEYVLWIPNELLLFRAC